MRRSFLTCLLALSLGGQACAQAPAAAPDCAIAWLRARLWWRETTSYNSGPGIDEAIRANHGNPRDEYCGHTQAGAQRACGRPVPAGSGGSYNWFLASSPRTFFIQGVRGSVQLVGRDHLVGLYSRKRGRVAHITRTVEVVWLRPGQPRGFYCIGGNEGTGTNAGMHLNFYPAASIYAASDWRK